MEKGVFVVFLNVDAVVELAVVAVGVVSLIMVMKLGIEVGLS